MKNEIEIFDNLSQESVAKVAFEMCLDDAVNMISKKFSNKDNENKLKVLKLFIQKDEFLRAVQETIIIVNEVLKKEK
jgi:hypothetical protein